MKHGAGILTYANGDIYDGFFRLGFMNGHGTFRFGDGGLYCGEFSEGKIQGNGQFSHKNGEMEFVRWKGSKCLRNGC